MQPAGRVLFVSVAAKRFDGGASIVAERFPEEFADFGVARSAERDEVGSIV
jgi:hypothetical protein